jgi:hypothetical protein
MLKGVSGAMHRPPRVQCLVEAERIAHAHQRDADRAAKIRQHLPDELMQFRFVHLRLPAPICLGAMLARTGVWSRIR